MGFKTGVLIGFAAGYVFGAKAGKERYEQIRRAADKAWESQPAEKIRSTAAGAAGDLGHKAVDKVKHIRDREQEPSAEDLVTSHNPDGNGSV